ncbi:MAG: coenzyme F420-0:L-glutamate ligase [Patescibacteria group bacterium]
MTKRVSLYPLMGLPLIVSGDNIAELIIRTCLSEDIILEDGDIIVIAQKIISKSENAIIDLKTITPSQEAEDLAKKTGRDARLVQVYLDESLELLYTKGRMIITRHKLGFIMSSSGVDRSNVASHADEIVVLLPKNPDQSAKNIREGIYKETNKDVAVIINDSGGRPDREGSVGIAIGLAGIAALEVRSQNDLFGNPAKSQIALIDELAAAASVLMGQADEKVPVVIIRGVNYTRSNNAKISDILGG